MSLSLSPSLSAPSLAFDLNKSQPIDQRIWAFVTTANNHWRQCHKYKRKKSYLTFTTEPIKMDIYLVFVFRAHFIFTVFVVSAIAIKSNFFWIQTAKNRIATQNDNSIHISARIKCFCRIWQFVGTERQRGSNKCGILVWCRKINK